ncbi:S8 family serine peptidase [Halorussus sp. MSC15.2]|uniref:S8 family serine peptidase n=1 Tax=Halorussus sp. MSC15.2 TaxID=2283638 RepID=UPI0013D58706|nr:S8 family serine peptidase [Halorussus sp. MSC15.2]NEU58948.1 S8 family serine peptidase [Halorussus sp. MSC15.2]
MNPENSTDDDESSENDSGIRRRTLVKAAGLAAASGPVGLGVGEATAGEGFAGRFRNWRAREAQHAWDRGYRGRPDRTLALTDSGQDTRHPDLGPWNGVTAFVEDGELKLTKPEDNTASRTETDDGESFSATMGPGSFATGEEASHEFTAPGGVDEIDAELSWSPNADASNDLEFRLDEYVNGHWETVTRSATGSLPEKLVAPVENERRYRFAVEADVNTTTSYEISADYYRVTGTVKTYDDGVVFEGTGGEPTPDTPKAVGWYDPGSRYGYRKKPRDPDGHGSHCSSIMAGTGRASAVDADSVQHETPRTALSEVTNGTLSYEVETEAGTGVFGSAYGDLVRMRIEGPDGETLDSSTATDDASEWDNNVVETPAEQTGTYTVYVETAEGEQVTAAYVEEVAVGAFRDPERTVGERDESGDAGFHAGLAPDQSIVCLQGLSAPTEDLGRLAEQFADTFNIRTVNMSWGYVGGLPLGAAAGTLDRIPATIRDVTEGGILTCAAAGNAATPVNGNGSPAVADEAISVAATGPLDGISGYSSGGIGAVDEDEGGAYMKPDLTAPGGTVTDPANAAKAGRADTPGDEQPAVRDYTGKAGTSMASPYATGVSGLVAQAMEEDAPGAISLPAPAESGFDDVMRLKQTLLATATETAFTAAPYHRAKTPTYDFGGRDPYEGFGRVNPGPAIDAATRELALGGASAEVVGLNVPDDERAAAGYLDVEPGTYEASVSFSHLSGGDEGAAKGNPHVDLYVYDAENPAANGEPNVVARAQGLEGSPTATFTTDSGGVYYVVAKLVNVPGVVNGDDVQVHFDLSTATVQGFVAAGARSDDGDAFTGGQTNRVDISTEASEAVEVRDAVPSEWNVLEEQSDDVNRVERAGDAQYVYLGAGNSVSATYFAEAPDSADLSNAYAFGPVQVSADGGETWVQLSGTSDTNVVAAADTEV